MAKTQDLFNELLKTPLAASKTPYLLRRLDVDRQGFGMLDNDLIAFFDFVKSFHVFTYFQSHGLLLRPAQSHRAIFVIDILDAHCHFGSIDGDSTGLLS